MLNSKEVSVMQCVYEVCKKNNGSAILTDRRITQSLPEKFAMTDKDVSSTLKQLEYDGYFECTKSDRRGETVNVINLKEKGKAFQREMVQRKREVVHNIVMRIIYASLGAIVTLLVSNLLKML